MYLPLLINKYCNINLYLLIENCNKVHELKCTLCMSHQKCTLIKSEIWIQSIHLYKLKWTQILTIQLYLHSPHSIYCPWSFTQSKQSKYHFYCEGQNLYILFFPPFSSLTKLRHAHNQNTNKRIKDPNIRQSLFRNLKLPWWGSL